MEEVDISVKPTHNWVKRGLVMSCEGAGHPSHRVFVKETREEAEE